MATLKYTITPVDPDVEWEELMYHNSLKVVGGIVETDNELDIDFLLRRGYEIVDDAAPAPAKKSAKKQEAAPEDEAEQA